MKWICYLLNVQNEIILVMDFSSFMASFNEVVLDDRHFNYL